MQLKEYGIWCEWVLDEDRAQYFLLTQVLNSANKDKNWTVNLYYNDQLIGTLTHCVDNPYILKIRGEYNKRTDEEIVFTIPPNASPLYFTQRIKRVYNANK